MKAILQGFYQKEHFWLRLGVVLLAVFGMGFALSLLLLVDMGTDPCSMMSKAISAKIGMSFGNWQAPIFFAAFFFKNNPMATITIR